MRINLVQYKQNFRGAFALIGTREQIKEASMLLCFSNGVSLTLPATSVYQNQKEQSPYTEYIKQGKNISYVITGEDVQKVCSHSPGWEKLENIANQIDKFIILNDIKKQMRVVKKSMVK